MHELGHALYEQGFPASADRTPVFDAPSLGAHESQSRFWENQIGRTAAFWDRLEPAMRRTFPEAMSGIDGHLLYRAARVVAPSLIRVEADEVTYNLHIVLRFQLELALLRGELDAADLPGAFSDGMEERARHPPPERRGRRHAGHPLGGRALRLLPDLHPRQPVLRPARRGGPGRARRPRGR